jgi:hypothetical protein
MSDDNSPVLKVEFNEDHSAHSTKVEHFDPTTGKDIMPIASFLNVKMTSKANEQINLLVNEVKADNPKATTGDIFQYIRNLESRLSAPQMGETRLNRISRYLALHNKAKEYEKRRDALLQ